jgi:hypothetical protein
MQSRSEVRPGSRLLAAVLSGVLCSTSIAPYAMAQGKPPAKGAPAKAPAKPAPAKGAPATPPAKGAPPAPAAKGKPSTPPMNDAQKKVAARKAYEDGMKKLEAKDYTAALTAFKLADEILPAAAAKHKIALCYDGLNQVPEAIAAYEAFIAQANPDKQKDQIDSSNKRLGELKMTPGSVRLASDPPDATVQVDGQAQMGVTPMDLKLAPGKHKVKVAAPGYAPTEQDVEIKPAEKAPDLTVTLTKKAEVIPLPVATPSAAPVQSAPPAPTAPPAEAKPKSNLPAYVVLGVAGVGAIVGAVFGVKALNDKSDFDKNPTGPKADDAERNALIADMAFGVAVTLGVTGTVLLLSGGKKEAQKGLWNSPTKTMQITPLVTPHSAGAGAVLRF